MEGKPLQLIKSVVRIFNQFIYLLDKYEKKNCSNNSDLAFEKNLQTLLPSGKYNFVGNFKQFHILQTKLITGVRHIYLAQINFLYSSR